MNVVALIVLGFSLAPSALAQVRPADFAEVKECTSMGEIEGKSAVCSLGRARADAMKRASAAGATHIVWTNARCVLFVGHRATGEMFDCNRKPTVVEQQGRPPGPLGLYVELIPADRRGPLKRNTGAYVTAVAEESTAFFANILPGDVIIAAGDAEVRTPKDLDAVQAGVVLTVLRDGGELRIETSR